VRCWFSMGWQRRQEGFSLLEVMMVLGILGIIGVGFLSALTTSTQAAGTLDEHTQAAALSCAQLERIKAETYRDCTNPPTDCYSTITGIPKQHTVNVAVDCSTDGTTWSPCTESDILQRVRASVSSDHPLMTLATYRKK